MRELRLLRFDGAKPALDARAVSEMAARVATAASAPLGAIATLFGVTPSGVRRGIDSKTHYFAGSPSTHAACGRQLSAEPTLSAKELLSGTGLTCGECASLLKQGRPA